MAVFGLFNDYSKQPPAENVQNLTVEQINNPTDPYVNYNLGVALYQTEKFDQAKNNFQRTLMYAKKDTLKERANFNLANSCYKQALQSLPVNWQSDSVDVDQNKIMVSIQQIQEAIKSYEASLKINKNSERTKVNLAHAKDILKKLQKKLKQQQNKEQNKDSNKDQDKDQQRDKKQKDSSQNQEQKNQNEKSSENGKKGDNKQDEQQNPAGNNQNSSDKPSDQKNGGEQKKSDQEETKNEKQQNLEHDQNQSKQDKDKQEQSKQEQSSQQKEQNQEQAQQAATVAAQQEDPQDSLSQKSARALLDGLQNYETNLQKIRIIQKTQSNQKMLTSSQKPW